MATLDRDAFLRDFNDVFEAGKQFAAKLTAFRETYDPFSDELDDLIDNQHDAEILALIDKSDELEKEMDL